MQTEQAEADPVQAPGTVVTEELARGALLPLLRAADVLPCWPLSSAQAVDVLAAAGYQTTADELTGWKSRQIVSSSTRYSDNRRFTALEILGACCVAEKRRQWIPSHQKHAHKLFVFEADWHNANELERAEMLKAGEHFNTDDLCVLAALSDDLPDRVGLLIALRERIRQTEARMLELSKRNFALESGVQS